ncbi:MAG: hypothetical protein IT159_02625 [Bryobacterales bacterium]|jgi:hypothetical protein|nr:hypothetical protein [Bryobacterales bacterium]
MANEATLSAALSATREELRIEYLVSNTSPSGLFLIDVSVRPTPDGTSVETGVPRLELTPQRQVLLLYRLRQPDRSRSYAVPPSAFAALLESGRSRKVSASVRFPLIATNLPPSKEVQEAVCDRVALILGYVPVPAVPAAVETEVAGVKLWRLPPDAWRHQKELRFEAVVPNLRVLVNK